MVTKIDTAEIEKIIRAAAEKCVLPYYGHLKDRDIHSKTSPNDLQTLADIKTEEYLAKKLNALYPDSLVIGEEGAHDNPAILDALLDEGKVIWVLDPVDGTYNFRHERRHFAVMVACVINGVTEFGWIYDVLGEKMLSAARGQGTVLAGKPVGTAPEKTLDEVTGYVNFGFFPKSFRDNLKAMKQHLRDVKALRCAGHEYLNIAAGDDDFALYSRMKPWDHLAGTLAVQEAGGYVAKLDKTPYMPGDHSGAILVASNEAVWNAIHTQMLAYKLPEKFITTN